MIFFHTFTTVGFYYYKYDFELTFSSFVLLLIYIFFFYLLWQIYRFHRDVDYIFLSENIFDVKEKIDILLAELGTSMEKIEERRLNFFETLKNPTTIGVCYQVKNIDIILGIMQSKHYRQRTYVYIKGISERNQGFIKALKKKIEELDIK